MKKQKMLMSANASQNNHQASVDFLIELRKRLIQVMIVLLFFFAIFTYFANNLYTWLAIPLLKYLPQGHLIATQIVSPFFVPFKLALMAACLASVPFLLYQLWAFITPALYGYEKKWLWPFLLLSIMLFYVGILFAYYLIFPALFHFLANTAPSGVILTPDMSDYLDFTIKLLLAFGGLFEIPMIMALLIGIRTVTYAQFKKKRSYALVGAFIVGMFLSPPDVLSQTLVAIPIYFLYEIGLLLGRMIDSRQVKQIKV